MSMTWAGTYRAFEFAHVHFHARPSTSFESSSVYRTAESERPVCAEFAPSFTVHIRLALFPLSANIARASGESFALGSVQETQLFHFSRRVMAFWYGTDATTIWCVVRAGVMIDESLKIDWHVL